MPVSLHEACQPLALLLGEWHGSGRGQYPGLTEFEYREQVTFSHIGKPFLTYSQKTQNVFDGQPLHSEQGFLRIIDDKKLEMVVAQPTGIVEVHHGFYASNPKSCLINLHATEVSGTATAKPVEQVQRLLRIADNILTYNVSMAAGGEPIQQHLEASLERVPSS